MKYVFRGHIDRIEGALCWIEMRDLTQPDNPNEEWCVPIARLPRPPQIGERLTLTITARSGKFVFDRPRRYTQADLDRAHQQAEKWMKLFGDAEAERERQE
jgi:hypothetical protein